MTSCACRALRGQLSRRWWGLCLVGTAWLAGCGEKTPQANNTSPPTPSVAPSAPALPSMNIPGMAPVGTPGDLAQSGAPPAAPLAGQPPADAERVVAQAGVAAAGRSLDNETGIIVEPAKALFAVRERTVFEISIPQAMSLFQATEGRFPQSHDEFMQRIISANSIQLPALPAGQRYVYDPQRNELMVERPGRK